MQFKRVIARLDIKSANVVKGIHLEGLRVVGSPCGLAEKYDREGIDEIIYLDTVASLYGRNHLREIILEASEKTFVPLTVGGGIRSVDDVRAIIAMGADKVSVNTHAVRHPEFVTEAARLVGSQAITVAVEAKRVDDGWRVYTENAREPHELDAIEWCREVQRRGAGEILLVSIDRDGTTAGFDLELTGRVVDAVSIPVIASGGAGTPAHVVEVFRSTGCSGVALASILHYDTATIGAIKDALVAGDIAVRHDAPAR